MKNDTTLNLFNFDILNVTRDEAIQKIFDADRQTVAFLNAHCINVAANDSVYRWALSKATTLLPDGSGMNLAAKISGKEFVENLNGTDLFLDIIKEAASREMKVFFLGSQPGIAARAAENANSIEPSLKIAGTQHGFFKPEDESKLIDSINASGADVVLVALGVPRQDIWIARNRGRLNARVVFGVGAQFDFWSGRVSRAPMVLRKLGLEWTWRLAIEPQRMFKRYIFGNSIFVGRIFSSWFSKKLTFQVDRLVRRLLDIVISGGALFVLMPLIALIALAIKIECRGSSFFKQTRVGENGKHFKIYKFRSMYMDAEARRNAVLHTSGRKGICFKSKNDPRVTRVGKFLRRFSLDELPQIINVLKGEMAIVGPRPALPQEVAVFPAKAMGRLAAKPGLTGLWQVSGRAEVSFDRMINMDLAYTRSRTIFSDLLLILLTFRALVTGRGAY
jgi:exopolysaccharide biosynthesis WecB/TagA/CpsF family protein